MRQEKLLAHEFVEFVPDVLKEGILYVSMQYTTVVHKCCCGCGNEVVTPLSPTDWRLIFDGKTISLDPSIGNWSFECQSHYWIKRNKVVWARRWSQEKINAGRAYDSMAKESYFGATKNPAVPAESASIGESRDAKPKKSAWEVLKTWFRRK